MGKKRSPEWLRGERHGARAAAENAVKYGRSFAERGLRDLQANIRRGHDVEDFDRGYVHAYAAALKAPMSSLQELGRPLTKAELDRDIQEALSRRRSAHAAAKPELIGVSPAGVEWVAYKPEHVEPMKARLTSLHHKHSDPEMALKRARDHYDALRARVFRAQGLRRKRDRAAMSDDAYWALSDELREARRVLRAAERKAKRAARK